MKRSALIRINHRTQISQAKWQQITLKKGVNLIADFLEMIIASNSGKRWKLYKLSAKQMITQIN